MSLRNIATQLCLSRGAVRRFACATEPEQSLVYNGTGYRTSILDEYRLYPCTNDGTRAAATPPTSTPN